GHTPHPSAVGQAVSVMCTVAVNGAGSWALTGTVTVSDGTQSCNASVAVGSCSIAFNSAGGRTVAASYAGDGNFAGSTAAGVTHKIGRAASTERVQRATAARAAEAQPIAATAAVR